MKKLCNVTVTFSDGRGAVIKNLDEDQVEQLSAILEASSVWYRWQGDYPGVRAAQKETRWRRLCAWLMPLLLVGLLVGAVQAQDVVQPVKVVIKAQAGDELTDAVRAELRSLRTVAVVTRKPDYEIHLNGKRLTSGQCRGVVGAVLVVRRSDGLHALAVYTGADFGELAAFIVETINTENFADFRANALQRGK